MILYIQKIINEILIKKEGIKPFNIKDFREKKQNKDLNTFLNWEKAYYDTFLKDFNKNDEKFKEIKNHIFKSLPNKYFQYYCDNEAKNFIIEQITLSLEDLESYY